MVRTSAIVQIADGMSGRRVRSQTSNSELGDRSDGLRKELGVFQKLRVLTPGGDVEGESQSRGNLTDRLA
jgi:hypothetical protein